MIIKVDDPLLTGHSGLDDGFEDYLGELNKAEEAMVFALGGEATGLMGLIVAQLIACGPTGGTTCVTAAATAIIAVVGGFATGTYHYFVRYLPQLKNLRESFDAMDIVRP